MVHIDATQNASPHHANEKKKQKDRGTKRQDQRRKRHNDMSSTGDESEDGQSSNTHKDLDKDVSFENDTEEQIDTSEIEEEDWIEYVKRSTNDAMEKMDMRRFDAGTRLTKMKWRLVLRLATSPSERWLMKAAEWNPHDTGPTERLGDQEEDGKTTSMI